MDIAPNEQFDRDYLSLTDWEILLKAGWDRVGEHFFHRRFDYFETKFETESVLTERELLPMRYKLSGLEFTKSQRIVLKRNSDLQCIYRETELTEEKIALFNRWYFARFGFVSNIFTWVSLEKKPFPTFEVCFYKGQRLVACSFFDITKTCQYSTAAMFDPDESRRSLGTLTLLAEIRFGMILKKKYHFPGHAYVGRSVYDYKKCFNNMEAFDWETGKWRKLARPERTS